MADEKECKWVAKYKQTSRGKSGKLTILTRPKSLHPCPHDVMGLVHGTSLQYLDSIFTEGKIRAQVGDKPRIFQGNTVILNRGAFAQLVFTCNQGKLFERKDCAKDIMLVFSVNLLNIRKDYHVSNQWIGGMQKAPANPKAPGPMHIGRRVKSYTSSQFRQFLKENTTYNCSKAFSKNEVVFEKHIPLKFLEAIWICHFRKITVQYSIIQPNGGYGRIMEDVERDPEIVKRNVTTLLRKHHIENVDVSIIKTLPSTRYIRGCPSGSGAVRCK